MLTCYLVRKDALLGSVDCPVCAVSGLRGRASHARNITPSYICDVVLSNIE